MPNWYGIMDFTSEFSFPHITKTDVIGEEGYHTVEQIRKLREGK